MEFEMTINFGFGESIEISTDSFWKLAMLSEFVRFVDELEQEDDEQEEEEEEEEYEFDDEGVAYWFDEENEVWYFYDEESDDWYECEEEECVE